MSKVELQTTPIKNEDGSPYIVLTIDDEIWMTNNDEEKEYIKSVVWKAKWNCLIAGLGLGLVVRECAKQKNVDRIVIIESRPDVCDLVCPTLGLKYSEGIGCALNMKGWTGKINGKVVNVYVDDILDENIVEKLYVNEPRFDWVYLDIWMEPDDPNTLDEYNTICKNIKKIVDPLVGEIDAWQKKKILAGPGV